MPCPLCNSHDAVSLGDYRAQGALMTGRARSECKSCGLVFVEPMPSDAEWTRYNSDYFVQAHGNAHLAKRAVIFRSALGKIRAAHVEDYVSRNGCAIGRVLEVGPGFGEFAETWKSKYPSTKYSVLETDSSLHARLQSLGIDLFASFEAARATGGYDLVLASHVLEHTLDPVGFLGEMTRCLRPGGVVFIEVPCRDDTYKDGDEPHTLFFDKPAMASLAATAGLANVELTYHGEPRDIIQRDRDGSRAMRIARRLIDSAVSPVADLPSTLSRPERTVIRPFRAGRASTTPARWLRMVAQKPQQGKGDKAAD